MALVEMVMPKMGESIMEGTVLTYSSMFFKRKISKKMEKL